MQLAFGTALESPEELRKTTARFSPVSFCERFRHESIIDAPIVDGCGHSLVDNRFLSMQSDIAWRLAGGDGRFAVSDSESSFGSYGFS